MQKIFACRIWNPGLWNRNPAIWNPEPGLWNPEYILKNPTVRAEALSSRRI